MELIPVESYVCAVHELASRHLGGAPPTVFLTTEDPAALRAFQRAAPSAWRVLHYAPALGLGDGKGGGTHQRTHLDKTPYPVVKDSILTDGAIGLESLVALLLALEARWFVLSSGSNQGHTWCTPTPCTSH